MTVCLRRSSTCKDSRTPDIILIPVVCSLAVIRIVARDATYPNSIYTQTPPSSSSCSSNWSNYHPTTTTSLNLRYPENRSPPHIITFRHRERAKGFPLTHRCAGSLFYRTRYFSVSPALSTTAMACQLLNMCSVHHAASRQRQECNSLCACATLIQTTTPACDDFAAKSAPLTALTFKLDRFAELNVNSATAIAVSH